MSTHIALVKPASCSCEYPWYAQPLNAKNPSKMSFFLYLDKKEENQLVTANNTIKMLLKAFFNRTIKKFYTLDDGIVKDRSVNPVNQSGERNIH